MNGFLGSRVGRCVEGSGKLIEEDDDDRGGVCDEIEEGVDRSFAGEVIGE